jgi:cephalosporin-C deacetylase-like acetyl esterase
MMDEKVNYTEEEEEKKIIKNKLSPPTQFAAKGVQKQKKEILDYSIFSHFYSVDTFQGDRISQSVRYGEQ